MGNPAEQTMLIVDSGATKASWVLLSRGKRLFERQTPGLNPYFLSDEAMREQFHSLASEMPPQLESLHFYSTGCGTPDQQERVGNLLRRAFATAVFVTVDTDILAAARSAAVSGTALVGILGTGSNACRVANGQVEETAGGFGFILGDEGSGAALGLALVRDWIRDQLPADLHALVSSELGLRKEEVFQSVYRDAFPSRFLAGFAPFYFKHQNHPWIVDTVSRQFHLFVRTYLLRLLLDEKSLKTCFVGSIAHFFEPLLRKVLKDYPLQQGTIAQDPMEGLISYHLENG